MMSGPRGTPDSLSVEDLDRGNGFGVADDVAADEPGERTKWTVVASEMTARFLSPRPD